MEKKKDWIRPEYISNYKGPERGGVCRKPSEILGSWDTLFTFRAYTCYFFELQKIKLPKKDEFEIYLTCTFNIRDTFEHWDGLLNDIIFDFRDMSRAPKELIELLKKYNGNIIHPTLIYEQLDWTDPYQIECYMKQIGVDSLDIINNNKKDSIEEKKILVLLKDTENRYKEIKTRMMIGFDLDAKVQSYTNNSLNLNSYLEKDTMEHLKLQDEVTQLKSQLLKIRSDKYHKLIGCIDIWITIIKFLIPTEIECCIVIDWSIELRSHHLGMYVKIRNISMDIRLVLENMTNVVVTVFY